MHARFAALSFIALLLGALPVTRAGADALDDRLATANTQALRGLEEAATFAMSNRMLGARHRTLRRILILAPDHAAARATLEFARAKKDGPWTQSKKYREPADWNKDALPEFERRLSSVLTAYRNDALVAVEDAGEDAGARKRVLIEQLAILLPDDEVVHKARGDVRLGGSWVMPETARAIERRRELRALASDAMGRSKPSVADAKLVGDGWPVAFRSASVVGASTLDGRSCQRAVDLCEGLRPFFTRIFDSPGEPAGLGVFYLLTNATEAADFFERGDESAAWARLRAAGVSGGYLRNGVYVNWGDDSTRAVEAVVRQAVDIAMHARFKSYERGWISEGVGRVLCWNFARIYGPSFVSIGHTLGKNKDDDIDVVARPKGDWLPVARDALRTLPLHRFAGLLTIRLTAMSTLESVLAYALGAYLLEGRPEKAAAFIDASVASDDAEKVVGTALGISVEELFGRVRRWTEEMTAPR